MAYEHKKSGATIFLDIVRNLLIVIVTIYIVFLVWKWNWIFALLVAIPVYIVVLNLVGFLTLPIYALTPENKLKAKAFNAFADGNIEEGKALTEKFEEKHKL